nr:hypothetical protein [Tanacetum cinerariifolium]
MTDSGHSTVLYTSNSSADRSWDIPDVDPYEEAALQAIEQVASPLSPAYLPDPIELDEHVLVYVLKPEYSEYLELPSDDIIAEDQPHADDAVPTALSLGYIVDSDPKEDPEEDRRRTQRKRRMLIRLKTLRRKIMRRRRSLMIMLLVKRSPQRVSMIQSRPRRTRLLLHHQHLDFMRRGYLSIPKHLCRLSLRLKLLINCYAYTTTISTYSNVISITHIPSPPLPVPSPPPMPSSPLPPPIPVETHAPKQDVVAALLMLPSTARRSEVLEADMPPRKRLCFSTPTIKFEVGESLAVAARPPIDLYGFVDTTEEEASITHRHARTLHDTERRMMTAVELVNLRVSYEAHTHQRDGTLLEDAYIELHEDLLRSKAYNESLEAHSRSLVVRIETIETRMTEMEDQFQETKDRAAMHKNSTNGDRSHGSGGGPTRLAQSIRACFYSNFMKYQPLKFKEIEGVVSLSRWFEKMESVFHISGCGIENQVKFATCTLLDAALTWWNGHLRTLALMCTKFVVDEKEKVDKYIGGLFNNIHGNVISARPKTLDEAIELVNDLMDQKLRTYAERQTESKRKFDNNNQCKFHHNGMCTTKYANCKKVDHLTRDCWNPTATGNQRTITCYEFGNQGHYKSDCLELKNRNHRNQAEGTGACGMVYDLGGGKTNPDHDDIEDDINA